MLASVSGCPQLPNVQHYLSALVTKCVAPRCRVLGKHTTSASDKALRMLALQLVMTEYGGCRV